MTQATALVRSTAPRRRDAPHRPPQLREMARKSKRRRIPETLAVVVVVAALVLVVVGQRLPTRGVQLLAPPQ